MSAFEHAAAYLELGWLPVPIPARLKKPVLLAWEQLRLTEVDLPRYFSADSNIGVRLEAPLVDIDLDCTEAIVLADLLLPSTWTFGRESAPRSHRLYLVEGATFERFDAPKEFAAMKGGKLRTGLLELRAGGDKQTVFPGSVHESGEPILWADDCDAAEEPTCISAPALRARCAKLAAVALAARVAGFDEARAWLDGAEPPALPDAVAALVWRWWGLERPRPISRPRRSSNLDVVERARRYLATLPPAVEHQGGHKQLLIAAEHMVRGFELADETALDLLREYSTRCLPPWSERELRHKVEQAREKGTAIAQGQHLEVRA